VARDCLQCHEKRQGERAAVVVHARQECQSCHPPHPDEGFERETCVSCHEEQHTEHGTANATGTDACLVCHSPHMPVRATAPHRKGWLGSKPCTDCHREQATRHGAHEDNAGMVCTECHQAHDPLAGINDSCSKCHARIHSDHPAASGRGDCRGCHGIHGANAGRVATRTSCVTCHKEASSEAALHGDKVRCKQCHKPHRFDANGQGLCAGCHEDVPSMRAGSGHSECRQCHQPHGPSQSLPSCKQCHGAQARSAPEGHADCEDCHDSAHATIPKIKDCTPCHEDQAETTHGRIAKDCASCHRAHGPGGRSKPPSCTVAACHPRSKREGLHAIEEHSNCRECHAGGHSSRTVREGRTLCTDACHTEQRDHVVKATSCLRCHKFGS
jgi:hypothetical protein